MHLVTRQYLALYTLVLFGAGCLSPVAAPKIAEQLETRTPESFVSQTNGFGQLPTIHTPARHAQVTLRAPLPTLSTQITVIRLHRGVPNETELHNIASAIGIPGSTLGDKPTQSALELSWTDASGYRWTYHADDRVLEFALVSPPASPLTVSSLPSNEDISNIASAFLLNRGFNSQLYRNALVDPDWNTWWSRARNTGLCMDIPSLQTVRAIGASNPFLAGGLPSIPVATSTSCVAPEFPTRAVVRYDAFIDQRDVVQADGTYVPGIELVIDTASKLVISGHISLFSNADRSDYPSLTAEEATTLLENGGINPITGDVIVSTIDFASYRIERELNGVRNTFLVPTLVGSGARTLPSGATEPVRIVAPLLKQ